MPTPFRIMIADDDADDIQLTKECLQHIKHPLLVNEVSDGEMLMQQLNALVQSNQHQQLPQLILLDLNMPRKSGLEALKELKDDEILRRIPVIIFTTSKAQKEIDCAYELGASCFVSKPNTIEEWCDKMGKLSHFWIECVKLTG